MGSRLSIASGRRRNRVLGITRTLAGAAAAALLAGSFSALAPTAAVADTPAPAPGTAPPAASPDASALAQAESTGQSVPVTADETADSTTEANPDGSFTSTRTVVPTRVQQNGSWVPVDPTLQQTPGGTLVPKAAESSVAFSGGGSGPLATLTSGAGQQVALSWPAALPAPSVSGATATYANVYPGVNLAMTATIYGGYTEQLIVTSATAAANPALKDIHFGTSATGLVLGSNADGGLQATDPSGAVVFTSPAATMWSAPSTPSTPSAASAVKSQAVRSLAVESVGAAPSVGAATPAATTPEDASDPVADLGVKITSGGMDLIPPSGTLTGSNVHYPVVIDPDFSPAVNGWTWVSSNDPSSNFWEGNNNTHDTDAHVGYDDWCSNGASGCSAFGVTRSLFDLPMTQFAGTNVTAASLSVSEQGPTSSESGTRQIDLHGAGAFSDTTTWSNQPTPWSAVAASANFASLNSNSVGNANFDVTGLVQSAVAAGYHSQTMVLEAHDESDDTAYRYMIGNAGANAPKLTVTYYSTPDLPSNLALLNGTKSDPCHESGGIDTVAPGYWVNSKTVQLSTTVSSPDSGTPVTAEYWYHETKPTVPAHWTESVAAPVNAAAGDAATAVAPMTMPTLTDGEQFQWQVYATEDSANFSSVSAPSATDSCWFSVDLTPPTLSSTTTPNPPTTAGGAPGTLGVTATDGGTNPSGVAKILYNMNGTSLTAGGSGETAITTTGSATIPLTADSWGTNTVWYAAEDVAGNISTPQSYSFYVAPPAYTPGTAGDLSGDGKPDLAAVDSSGDIVYSSNPLADTPGNAGGTSVLIPASQAVGTTGAATFTGALLAHSGSVHGQNCDDLDVIQNGNLIVEENNNCLVTSPSATWTPHNGQRPPAPVAGTPAAAAAAYAGDWSQVQQVVALSALNSSNVLATTDLVTLELSGGTEYLWEFPMDGPNPEPPTLLASGSAWSGVTLINPGPVNGNQALWTRNTSTGAMTQYPDIAADTTNTLTGSAITTSGLTGPLTASAYPVITSAEFTGSGGSNGPALWAVGSDGTLQLVPTGVDTGGNVTVLDPEAMTAAGWATGLTAVS
jgi:hypothetical protein